MSNMAQEWGMGNGPMTDEQLRAFVRGEPAASNYTCSVTPSMFAFTHSGTASCGQLENSMRILTAAWNPNLAYGDAQRNANAQVADENQRLRNMMGVAQARHVETCAPVSALPTPFAAYEYKKIEAMLAKAAKAKPAGVSQDTVIKFFFAISALVALYLVLHLK